MQHIVSFPLCIHLIISVQLEKDFNEIKIYTANIRPWRIMIFVHGIFSLK